jgi:hypothetical protein
MAAKAPSALAARDPFYGVGVGANTQREVQQVSAPGTATPLMSSASTPATRSSSFAVESRFQYSVNQNHVPRRYSR